MSSLAWGKPVFPGILHFLMACLLVSGLSASECKERVIEWIREPARTTKKITVDGTLVYHNTWLPDATGKTRPIGPGWIQGKGDSSDESPEPPPEILPIEPSKPARKKISKSAAQARKVALSFLGVPYKQGGMDRRGLNSSGVAYAFLDEMGVDVSRELLAQYRSGTFVLRADLQPGDLVFHHSEGANHTVPDMVGVFVGEGEIIYMSGSRKRVIRAEIETPWWEARYKGSRRLLGTLPRKKTVEKMPVDPESAAKQSKPVAPKKPPARYIEGMASYYGCGDGFHSSGTASGEVFDEKKLTTAHYDLAFGTRLEVANLSNGKKVEVRVNDRGPFEKKNGKWVRHSTRILDLSCRAAELLDFKSAGLTRVRARILD